MNLHDLKKHIDKAVEAAEGVDASVEVWIGKKMHRVESVAQFDVVPDVSLTLGDAEMDLSGESFDDSGRLARAIEELRLALAISTSSNARALAESAMFGGCLEKDSPAYFHAKRLVLMVEMENHIAQAVDSLQYHSSIDEPISISDPDAVHRLRKAIESGKRLPVTDEPMDQDKSLRLFLGGKEA